MKSFSGLLGRLHLFAHHLRKLPQRIVLPHLLCIRKTTCLLTQPNHARMKSLVPRLSSKFASKIPFKTNENNQMEQNLQKVCSPRKY